MNQFQFRLQLFPDLVPAGTLKIGSGAPLYTITYYIDQTINYQTDLKKEIILRIHEIR
jgi:hypothetical protein